MSRPVHPLKVYLVAAGRTQRDFAATVGVSPAVFNLVVNGHHSSWPALRQRCAAELGVDEESLFPAALEPRRRSERTDQGFADTVQDPAALARVAALLAERGAA